MAFKQWGSYPREGGNIKYPISFTTKVYAIIGSSALDSNDMNISNLTYWYTNDTNHGVPNKVAGRYIAIGK